MVTNGKEEAMTTTTMRVEHPLALGGRARSLWATSHLVRLLVNLAFLALVGYFVTNPSLEGLPGWAGVGMVAVVGGAIVAARGLRWLAWAEVPGAWRTYRADEDSSATDRRADRWLGAFHGVVMATGGVLIATLLDERFTPVIVGGIGGAMLGLWGFRVGRDIVNGRGRPSGGVMWWWAIELVPALAWAVVGSTSWVWTGVVFAVMVSVFEQLLRQIARHAADR